MKLTPWKKRAISARPDSDYFWDNFRGALATPLAALESRLPEVLRTSGFPPVNVSETETRFTVTAELPGLEEDDIQVQVMGDQLVISGERKWSDEEEEECFHHVESQYGPFERSIALPTGLVTDADTIDAHYKKGILEVSFLRTEPSRARRIDVKTD